MANSDNDFPKDGEDVLDKSLAVQVAIMATGGMVKNAIAKKLKVSASKVNRILQSDECIAAMQKITNEALATAKSRIRLGAAELSDEVLRVLKENLAKNNLNAVPYALKILGFSEEERVEQDTKIVVMMPGSQGGPVNITPKKGNSDA